MNIFRSYIVFSERCELKRITTSKTNVRIIKRNQLQNTLNEEYEKYGTVLLDSQIRDCNDKLIKYMFPKDDIKNKHIEYVEKIKQSKEMN